MSKEYMHEDSCYLDIHRDGKPYYQHEDGDPCEPDLLHLFSWDSFPRKGASILELGCGDGFVTAILASTGLSVTGLDCSPAAIRQAERNLAKAGCDATLHVADACNLESIEFGLWDSILDCHCLHCITDYVDRARFLRGCCGALSREGKLFLATMGEQSMEWTETIERDSWRKERKVAYHMDGEGCYVESIIPPGRAERVNSRIFIREDILRQELNVAGLVIKRLERFAPGGDPGDITFLVEAHGRNA